MVLNVAITGLRSVRPDSNGKKFFIFWSCIDSSSDEFIELATDYSEEVSEGDDITASDTDTEVFEDANPARPENPFIRYCQQQTTIATKHFQEQRVNLTAEGQKHLTKVIAEDWKLLPPKTRKQSASQKWYTNELLLPLFTNTIEEDIFNQWRWQQQEPINKNIFVDKDG